MEIAGNHCPVRAVLFLTPQTSPKYFKIKMTMTTAPTSQMKLFIGLPLVWVEGPHRVLTANPWTSMPLYRPRIACSVRQRALGSLLGHHSREAFASCGPAALLRPVQRDRCPSVESAQANITEQSEYPKDDQVSGHDIVEQSRHDQDENAGDE